MISTHKASKASDHSELLRIAKTGKYTKDFGNEVMFSSDQAYEKGFIRKATIDGRVVGFTCRRDKVRAPETVLYFIAVDPEARRKGVAMVLMKDLFQKSAHSRIYLNVAKGNDSAIRLYEKLGFTVENPEALNGTCLGMVKELTQKDVI